MRREIPDETRDRHPTRAARYISCSAVLASAQAADRSNRFIPLRDAIVSLP